MLASVSDLSEDFKGELRGIREALEQQRTCNIAIDEAVSAEVREQFHTFVAHYILETRVGFYETCLLDNTLCGVTHSCGEDGQ